LHAFKLEIKTIKMAINFAMDLQVVNLQAELAYVQARLATLQRLAPVAVRQCQSSSPTNHHSSSDLASSNYNLSMHFDYQHPLQPQAPATSAELASFFSPVDEEVEDADVQALAREIISRYLPGVRFRPSSPDH
jgi:hypothetical protein